MAKLRSSAVRRYHDRVAPRYDAIYDDTFWRWHDLLTWEYLKPYLPRDLRAPVVDLGCGTGKWAARLLHTGYTVTCVDISTRMLEQARHKSGSAIASSRATFIQADLCDLSQLPPGRFALALALGEPIGCAESPRQAMKQIRAILGEGGILVATFDNRLAALDYYLQRGDRQALARFLRDGKTHWLTQNRDEQFTLMTFRPRDILKLAEMSGLEVLEIVGKTVLPMRQFRPLLETPQDRRAWAGIEKQLSRDADACTQAPHFQVAFRAIPDRASPSLGC